MASKVGEAYVLVHTRTRPLTQAQKRAMDRDAGKAAHAWTSRFGKEVEEAADRQMAALNRRLAETFASGDFDRVRKEFGDTSKAVAHLRGNLQRLRNQKKLNEAEFDVLSNSVKRWEKAALDADKATRKLLDAKQFETSLQEQQKFNQRSQRLLIRRLNEEMRHNEAINKSRQQAHRDSVKVWDQEFARLEKDLADRERMYARAYRMNEEYDRRRVVLDERRLRQTERMHAAAHRMNDAFNRREREFLADRLNIHVNDLDRYSDRTRRAMTRVYRIYEQNAHGATILTRDLRRMNRQMARTPDILGTIFGRGSRNNFLNFMGSVVRNVSRLPLVFSNAFTGVADRVYGAAQAFKELAPQIGSVQAAMAVLRAPLAAAGPLLIGLAATMIGLSFAVPVLFSMMTMLAGSILAVAGAVVVALSAGLVAFGPLLLGVAAAIGTAIVLFTAWEDASDSVKASLDPLIDAWKELQGEMRRSVLPGVLESLGSLAGFIEESITPLLLGMGDAVKGVIDHFRELVESPDIKRMFSIMAEELPAVTETFGRAMNNMLIGLAGLFTAVLPQGEQLAESLERMMERFVDFTTSDRGKNKIAEWMETAWKAAEDLWDSLSNIKSILDTVFFSATEGAGGTFLEWLSDTTERFDAWLKSAEGQTALHGFFEDVERFMGDTKDLIWQIGDAWDALDTEEAREDLVAVMDALTGIAGAVETLGGVFEFISGIFRDLPEEWRYELGATKDFFEGIVETAEQEWAKFLVWGAENLDPKKWMRDLFGLEGGSWGEIWDELATEFTDGMKTAGSALNPKNWMREGFDLEGDSWGEIWEAFGEKFKQGMDNIWQSIKDWFHGEHLESGPLIPEDWDPFGDLQGVIDRSWARFLAWGVENLDVKQWMRDLFDVEGETFDEIGDAVWAKFIVGLGGALDSANEGLKGWANDLFHVDGESWDEIGDQVWVVFLSGVNDALTGANEGLKGWANNLFNVEGETWGEIAGQAWDSFVNGMADGLEDGVNWGNDGMKDAMRRLFNVEGETWDEIATNMWEGFKDSMNRAYSSRMDYLFGTETPMKDAIRSMFNVDGDTWTEIGENIVTGLHEGINNAFAAAGQWMEEKMDEWVVQPVLRFLRMASPSQLFADIGMNIVLGLWEGIQNWWASFSGWFVEQWESIKNSATTKATELVENVTTWFSELPGRITTWLTESWNRVTTWFTDMRDEASEKTSELVTKVGDWLKGLPQVIALWLYEAWNRVVKWFTDMYNSAVGKVEDMKNEVVRLAGLIPDAIKGALSTLVEKVSSPFRDAYNTAVGWWDRITGVFSGGISVPSFPSDLGGGSSRFATGGIVNRPTRALVGEAGPEAVIPLSRNLSLVDPSVRALSALLQGKASVAPAGGASAGKQIVFSEGSIVVQTMATDVVGVAESVVDRIAAAIGN